MAEENAVEALPSPEPIKLSGDIRLGKEEDVRVEEKKAQVKAATSELRLDLACGQSPQEGFEGVDLYSKDAKHKVDLWKFPWPWKDSSVGEIYCSHFIEHIPAREIESRDLAGAVELDHCGSIISDHKRFVGQDMFFAFFDECYRILKPGGKMKVICPSVRSERAFQDPTHRRFISQATFFYLSEEWRKANKLDHYNVHCNFAGDTNFSFGAEIQGRHEEVQRQLFQNAWNVIFDYIVDLKAIKS